MNHETNDSFRPPPFGQRASLNHPAFGEAVFAQTNATTIQTMTESNLHSQNVKAEPTSPEATDAPGMKVPGQKNKRRHHLISQDEDDDIKPVNFEKEAPRNKEIDHESFKKAEEAAQSIPAEIISLIDQSPVKRSDIAFIKDIASRALSPSYPTAVKLGLKGDSGSGKSSTINSLLGVPNLAPQGDGGKACTSVVHEFHKPRANQRHACEADVLFLAAPARLVILKEWLRDVFVFNHSDAKPGDDVFEPLEKASTTAIDGLFSLFCDRDEFQDRESIVAFLSNLTSHNDEDMIFKLMGWTEELLNDLEVISGNLSIKGVTPQDVQGKISRFTRHQKSKDINGRLIPSPWPFVKVVRLFYDQPILSEDIILVDLPGAQDVNQTRVRASMHYLDDVDYIGIVSRSDRVQTDDNTQKYLLDAFRRKCGASTVVIATNSDSVDMNPTSLEEKISVADSIDSANLTALRDKLLATKVKLRQIQRDVNDLKRSKSRSDRELLMELRNEQDELEARKNSLGERLFEYCVELRNEDTVQNVRQNYYNLTRDPVPLPVFCVSNLVYAKYASDNYEPPMMDVAVTNIPALRAFLYALPAFRKFRAFEHHRKVVLPSLLDNLDMTCSQARLARHKELHKIILSASAAVPGDIKNSFNKLFDDAILPVITIIKTNRAAYATYATDQLAKWSSWPSQTHKAFCIHRGNWCTKKVGRHNWNEELLQLLISDIEREKHGLQDAISDLSMKISEKLCKRVTDLIANLQSAAGSSIDLLTLFFEELRRQKDLLELKWEERTEKLERDLNIVKERITNTQDMDESYFVKALGSTYDDSVRISGQGSHAKRIEALSSRLTKKTHSPFVQMFEKAKKDFRDVIQQHMKQFTEEVKGIFTDISLTFIHGFKTEEKDTAEVKQLRELLRAKIPYWKGILTGTIDYHLAICREFAKSG